MHAYIPLLTKQGWNEEQLDGIRHLIDGLSAAEVAGEALYRQGEVPLDPDPDALPPNAPNPVSAPVFVVISGRCASAGLDAVDIFKQFDNVTLVGATTSADSNYMEIRSQPLPSGHATLYCPMKAYRNRVRGSGSVYPPDIEYNQPDWSDETFQPWLLSLIKE